MGKFAVTLILHAVALAMMVAGAALPGRLLSLPPGTMQAQRFLAFLSYLLLPVGLAVLLSPFDWLAGRTIKRVLRRIALRAVAFTLTCTGLLALVAEDRVGSFLAKYSVP